MRRWLTCIGPPVYPEDYLLCAENSLIDQNLHARMGRTATNGDGFGLGWYGARDEPGLFRDIRPPWNDDNLRNIAAQVRTRQFFAHVRAATNGRIARANCHLFRYGRWLFMHNGQIGGFDAPLRLTAALTDGETVHAVRYATDDDALLIVSEPLDTCPGHWREVEMSQLGTARDGRYDITDFAPDGSAP